MLLSSAIRTLCYAIDKFKHHTSRCTVGAAVLVMKPQHRGKRKYHKKHEYVESISCMHLAAASQWPQTRDNVHTSQMLTFDEFAFCLRKQMTTAQRGCQNIAKVQRKPTNLRACKNKVNSNKESAQSLYMHGLWWHATRVQIQGKEQASEDVKEKKMLS